MKKTLSIILAGGLALLTGAAAQAATYDMGEIEIGKVYKIPSSANFGPVTGTITPEQSGTLSRKGVDLPIYTSEDHSEKSLLEGTWVDYSYGADYTVNYQVEAGTTYYVYTSFVMLDEGNDEVLFSMADNQELELKWSIPEENEVISSNVKGTGEISLSFNVAAVYAEAYLVAPDGSKEQVGYGSESASMLLSFYVKDAMNAMYASGAISIDGGSEIVLSLKGLATAYGNLYHETGDFEIKYVASAKAPELVETNFENGRELKSYYPKGDSEAILTFTFDTELMNDDGAQLVLGMGNVENEGTYYQEILPVSIDGKTATADLSGKLRDLNAYEQYQGSSWVELKLINIRDTHGVMAAGSGNGSAGTYHYNFWYLYIEPANIASEFIPSSGSSLAGVDEIEIWFNNASAVTFEGVQFDYDYGKSTVIVPNDQLNIETANNEITITVAIPDEVKGTQGITVYLHNLQSNDGYDHTAEIRALYDQFVVTLLAPIQDGAVISSTGEDDFVVEVNEEVNYLRYDFYNGDEWAYGTNFNKQDNGTWTAFNNNYACYADCDNYMLIRAYDNEMDFWEGKDALKQCTFHFIGTVSDFVYSTYKFESITPTPDSVIEYAPGFYFEMKFDGLVTINESRTGIALGMGMGLMPFEKLEAINTDDDPVGFANTWRLYPGDKYMSSNSSISISVAAYDQYGLLIEGNSVSGSELDYLSFYYTISNESTIMPIEAAYSEADGQGQFVITSPDGLPVGINYSCGEMPSLWSMNFEPVLYFSTNDIVIDSEVIGEDELGYPIYSEQTYALLTFDVSALEPGAYELFIPEGVFMLGSQFVTYISEEYSSVFDLGSAGIAPVVTGEGVYEVYNLQGVKVMTAADKDALRSLPTGIYVINGKKYFVK